MDSIVRIMRENITGIRVVKALSKETFEKNRFERANERMLKADMQAGTVMAMPGPIMTLFLNVGLTLVVFFGAKRVNAGLIEPGVILAFLTYFNMIMMGVMGLNRIFMMMSKANALLLDQPTDHLDLESISAVNNGLSSFKGNVIFTSHDYELVNTVANRIIEIKPDGGIIDFSGTYEEYLEKYAHKDA
jgi:ATP-binding cassette subfamily B protein